MLVRNRIFALICFIFSVAVFFGARWHFKQSGQLLEISRAQVVSFPFFVFALWLGTKNVKELPRWIFAMVIMFGLTAVGFSYERSSHIGEVVVLAPLRDDSFLSVTRRTKTEMQESALLYQGLPVMQSETPIDSEADAEKVLTKNRNVVAVVWGSTRWLTVSLAKTPEALQLLSFGSTWAQAAATLKIITEVPSFGVSYAPIKDTSQFLTQVLSEDEVSLRSAAELQATWTGYAHRSYANLKLGNVLLKKALEAPRYQYGDFECSVHSYLVGWSKLSDGDNPELKRALLNNLAVATFIRGLAEENVKEAYQAQDWLRIATRIESPESSRGLIGDTALENYRIVRSYLTNKNLEKNNEDD